MRSTMGSRILFLCVIALSGASAYCSGSKDFADISLHKDGYAGVRRLEGAVGPEYRYRLHYEFFKLKKVENIRNGRLHGGDERWAYALVQKHEDGSLRLLHFDRNGVPVGSTRGYHEIILNKEEVRFREKWGKPVKDILTRAHRWSAAFDENGFIKSWKAMDRAGKPILSFAGVHEFRVTRSKQGTITERKYFDMQGKPVDAFWEKFHRMATTVDEKGRPAMLKYFQADGKPAEHRGCHGLKYKYSGDLLIEESCVGKDGKPAMRLGEKAKQLGYTAEKTTYDKRGLALKVEVFDAAGKPVVHGTIGAHRVTSKYDDAYRELESRNFDVKDAPMMPEGEGYHRRAYKYDARGLTLSTSFFDVKGKPVAAREKRVAGCAEVRLTYHAKGAPMTDACLGADGKPAMNTHWKYHKSARTMSPGRGWKSHSVSQSTRARSNCPSRT